jgi:hypothetical protein
LHGINRAGEVGDDAVAIGVEALIRTSVTASSLAINRL